MASRRARTKMFCLNSRIYGLKGQKETWTHGTDACLAPRTTCSCDLLSSILKIISACHNHPKISLLHFAFYHFVCVPGMPFSLSNILAALTNIVCDGAQTNQAIWNLFGVSRKSENLKNYMFYPLLEDGKVFFLSYFPHLFKCVRNYIWNGKEVQVNEQVLLRIISYLFLTTF